MGGRLVIIPRGDEHHTHLVAVMNPGGGSGTLNTGPATGCTASITEYMRWAGGTSASIDLSLPTLHAFMWSARTERWIERNCDRDVLLTPGSYGSSFRLTFLDGHHKVRQFNKRWNTSQGQPNSWDNSFVMAFEDQNLLDECAEWGTEHIQLGHQIISTEYARLGVFIDDDNEAVLFKLRWADYIIA
jgi:hypothetical protein